MTGLLFWCSTIVSLGQSADPKPHKWTLYGGIGPNYYFNNLDVGSGRVNELNFNFVTRLMWEPEHKLSLGFETGYNRLYTWNADLPGNNGSVHIENAAIPIMIVISMKFFENFYGNFSMGRSFLMNNVSTTNFGSFDASNASFADYGLTAGYRKKISDRFLLASEVKLFASAKLEDRNISLVFLAGYKLW